MEHTFQIRLMFGGFAFLAGLEAMKAERWRLWLFWGLTVLLAAAALFWQNLQNVSVEATNFVTSAATNSETWVVILVLFFMSIAVSGERRPLTSSIFKRKNRENATDDDDIPAGLLSLFQAQEGKFRGEMSGVLNHYDDVRKRLATMERRIEFPQNLGDTLGEALITYEHALNSQIARIRELVEKASEKLGNSHNEAVHLLDYCISTATRSVCRVLLAERPKTNKVQPPLDANLRANEIAEMRLWLQKVRHITSFAAFGVEIDMALRNGLQQAAEIVRQIPPAQRPRAIDPLAFHDYFVPAQQCEFVAQCLSYVIRELNRADRDRLERLREAFSVRAPKHH